MGINLSWISVRGTDRAELLDRLGFEAAGDTSDELGADYTCAELPGGWVVVASTDYHFDIAKTLAAISSEDLALGCEQNETVMFSQVRGFRSGRQVWSVTRDPDTDFDSVVVDGEPPPEAAGIVQRREAQQAADEDASVDYLFEAPLDLARSICGYRAGEGFRLAWTALRGKRPQKAVGRVRRPKSLRARIISELLPFLVSLGWTIETDRPALTKPGVIVRHFNGQEQTIWFEFADSHETYILVNFTAHDLTSVESGYWVSGWVTAPEVHLPLWKRFTWKHLTEMTRTPPRPDDVVGAVIDLARSEITIADTFLRSGQHSPGIVISSCRIPASANGVD
jgi:hypothetical protein